jgi:hypothetical protein
MKYDEIAWSILKPKQSIIPYFAWAGGPKVFAASSFFWRISGLV